jgi:hypothetical protein
MLFSTSSSQFLRTRTILLLLLCVCVYWEGCHSTWLVRGSDRAFLFFVALFYFICDGSSLRDAVPVECAGVESYLFCCTDELRDATGPSSSDPATDHAYCLFFVYLFHKGTYYVHTSQPFGTPYLNVDDGHTPRFPLVKFQPQVYMNLQ